MAAAPNKDILSKIEASVGDAHQLAILMQWVENARHLVGQFQYLSTHSKEFDAICKHHKIPVYNATWEEEHSDSLARLLSIQFQYLNAAQDAAKGCAA